MIYIQVVLSIFFICFSQVTVAADANEADANTVGMQIADTSESLFYQKQFSKLNQLEELYRSDQSRLPDGRWKLTFYYSKLGSVSEDGAENEWQYLFKLVDEWIKETPHHPTPYLVKAKMLESYAWDARGGADSELEEDSVWELFHERIAMASNVLVDSAGITGDNPYWYFLMEVIAKEQNWPVEPYKKLYEAAVKNSPTYYHLHFRAADFFQPIWHGSREELRAFVDNAVEKSKSLEGMTLYARIYWSQLWALGDKTFDEGYAEWKDMKQGFQDIMDDYPHSTWNLNAFAYYACMAEDWETYNELSDQIGPNKNMSIWGKKSRVYTCEAMSKGEKIKKPQREETEKDKGTKMKTEV